jgi:hypothetical protein
MAGDYMEKSSTPLTIKEMKIKTTLRFHLIPCRMAVIKKQQMLVRMWWAGDGTPIHYW